MFVIAASVLSVFVITPATAVGSRTRAPLSRGAPPFPATSFAHFGRSQPRVLPLPSLLSPAVGMPAVAGWPPGRWREGDCAVAPRHLAAAVTRLLGPAHGRHRRLRAEYVASRAIGDM
jgi:hypothetical protein